MEPITVTLDYPVSINGETVSEFVFRRRPKVRDSLIVGRQNKDVMQQEVHLLALLLEVPPAVIEELDMADYFKLSTVLSDFLS